MIEGTDMNQIEQKIARIIMENCDNGGCIVKDWEAEERDNPHVAQALRQSRSVITAIAAMQQAPQEPVAWRYTRADGHFFLTPKRCRDGYPEADGWAEEALYTGPTPPAGGSDD